MAAPVYHTAQMVRDLPDDGNRYETVHGELLVTPSPRAWHQEVVLRLVERLRAYTREVGFGHVLAAPADISWSDDVLVQPDVFVVDLGQARTMDWTQMQNLHLVIEVLSPSTARQDRFAKRRVYQEFGVSAYWIVDPDGRRVEVWMPSDQLPRTESERVRWQPLGVDVPFEIELEELFREL